MKKNILSSFLGLSALALALSSCNQDNIGPMFESDLNKSAVVEAATINGEVDAAENIVYVEVTRLSGEGSASVPIVVESIDDGLIIEDAVNFEDGETTAYLKVIAPDVSALDESKKYKAIFHIADGYRLPSDSYNTTVVVGIKPEPFCDAEYSPWLFGSSWKVEIRKSRTSNRFVVYDAIWEGYNFEMTFNDDFSELSADPQDTGYVHSSYGMVFWEPTGNFEYSAANKALAIETRYGVSAGYFQNDDGAIVDNDFYYLERPLYESK